MKQYKRIIIIGSAGSGKTVLSNKLSKKLNIEVTHLDKIYWQANWKRQPDDYCIEKTIDVVKNDKWILDGNYIQTLDIRLEKADLVILLKINRFKCIKSLFERRRLTRKNEIVRDDLADGCSDKLDFSFLRWAFNFNNKYAPKLLEKINNYPHLDVIVFNKREDACKFIDTLE